jgi:hypothetical protein
VSKWPSLPNWPAVVMKTLTATHAEGIPWAEALAVSNRIRMYNKADGDVIFPSGDSIDYTVARTLKALAEKGEIVSSGSGKTCLYRMRTILEEVAEAAK